ncbi:MAG TPA: NAD(P)H-hydrate dehydratase [Gammaproteobacteria bacterium]
MSTGLYRTAQVRELDRRVLAAQGIAGYELMQRAGRAVYAFVRRQYPGFCAKPARLLVVCGGGKNGGDGYVAAVLLHQAGYKVDVLPLVPLTELKGDVLTAAQAWRNCCNQPPATLQSNLEVYDLIIDALLGTGLQRPVVGEFAAVINRINQMACPVIAVDVPSGLQADTGQPFPLAIDADHTITFIAPKQGLYTGHAADYCGRIHVHDLDAPVDIYEQCIPSARLLQPEPIIASLPKRRPTAHKGEFGHVLVIGGDIGMQGAAQMAGLAALRSGAGLTTIATRKMHAALLSAQQPELMSYPVEQASTLKPLLGKATVIAVGPGLGQTPWAKKLLAAALAAELPLVVDADGLNLLALKPVARGNWIITPHPGEAARLLNLSTAEVQADRYAAVQQLAQRYAAVAVLKGSGTLIAAPDDPVVRVCDRGHPAMAGGGMGDILTGIIAGLLAQGMDLLSAAEAAVWLHARSGERAAAGGSGLLATDLLPQLQRLLIHAGI